MPGVPCVHSVSFLPFFSPVCTCARLSLSMHVPVHVPVPVSASAPVHVPVPVSASAPVHVPVPVSASAPVHHSRECRRCQKKSCVPHNLNAVAPNRRAKGLVNRRGSTIEDEAAGSTARMVGVGAMALPLLRRSYAESPEKKKSTARGMSPTSLVRGNRGGHEGGAEVPHSARSSIVRSGREGSFRASGAKTARTPRH